MGKCASRRIKSTASDNVAFIASHRGERGAVITDLGSWTDELVNHVSGCQHISVEANYDHNRLWNGPYPMRLKDRISGRGGHLSNDQTGQFLAKVVDSETSESFYVTNDKFLTEFQERQMSFQPDFILEYAHYIGDYYNKNGLNNVQVYAESFVTLNGRLSKRFIDPTVDLMKEKRGFSNKKWITNLDDEIKGF